MRRDYSTARHSHSHCPPTTNRAVFPLRSRYHAGQLLRRGTFGRHLSAGTRVFVFLPGWFEPPNSLLPSRVAGAGRLLRHTSPLHSSVTQAHSIYSGQSPPAPRPPPETNLPNHPDRRRISLSHRPPSLHLPLPPKHEQPSIPAEIPRARHRHLSRPESHKAPTLLSSPAAVADRARPDNSHPIRRHTRRRHSSHSPLPTMAPYTGLASRDAFSDDDYYTPWWYTTVCRIRPPPSVRLDLLTTPIRRRATLFVGRFLASSSPSFCSGPSAGISTPDTA